MHVSYISLCPDQCVAGRLERLLADIDDVDLQGVLALPVAGALDRTDLLVIAASGADMAPLCRWLQGWRMENPQAPVLVFATQLDRGTIGRLTDVGIYDFAGLDVGDEELLARINRALGRWSPSTPAPLCAEAEDETLLPLHKRLVGRSQAFASVLTQLKRMARCDASVLVLGETGTGKEVCTRAIHYSSSRAQGPWVAVNCAAIPADLVEDELFGHVRGAYTHASSSRAGLVQEAEGGTLLLDEIDSLPLVSQAKILRFLQEKEYRPVGSSRLQQANVRVIAASNRDLELAVQRGTFRQDLYFRLNVFGLKVPPLRERVEDILPLAQAFLDEFRAEGEGHLCGISPAAQQKLLTYQWPGNIRELRNAMQRAVLMSSGPSLQASDLQLGNASEAESPQEQVASFRAAKARVVEAFERRYLEQLLAQCEGNISRAARVASKDRRVFFELLRRYDIDAAQFRPALH